MVVFGSGDPVGADVSANSEVPQVALSAEFGSWATSLASLFLVLSRVPGGGPQGMTSPVSYWHVPDVEAKLAELTAAGATVKEPAQDVGGGRLVATVTDPDGNVNGLL